MPWETWLQSCSSWLSRPFRQTNQLVEKHDSGRSVASVLVSRHNNLQIELEVRFDGVVPANERKQVYEITIHIFLPPGIEAKETERPFSLIWSSTKLHTPKIAINHLSTQYAPIMIAGHLNMTLQDVRNKIRMGKDASIQVDKILQQLYLQAAIYELALHSEIRAAICKMKLPEHASLDGSADDVAITITNTVRLIIEAIQRLQQVCRECDKQGAPQEITEAWRRVHQHVLLTAHDELLNMLQNFDKFLHEQGFQLTRAVSLPERPAVSESEDRGNDLRRAFSGQVASMPLHSDVKIPPKLSTLRDLLLHLALGGQPSSKSVPGNGALQEGVHSNEVPPGATAANISKSKRFRRSAMEAVELPSILEQLKSSKSNRSKLLDRQKNPEMQAQKTKMYLLEGSCKEPGGNEEAPTPQGPVTTWRSPLAKDQSKHAAIAYAAARTISSIRNAVQQGIGAEGQAMLPSQKSQGQRLKQRFSNLDTSQQGLPATRVLSPFAQTPAMPTPKKYSRSLSGSSHGDGSLEVNPGDDPGRSTPQMSGNLNHLEAVIEDQPVPSATTEKPSVSERSLEKTRNVLSMPSRKSLAAAASPSVSKKWGSWDSHGSKQKDQEKMPHPNDLRSRLGAALLRVESEQAGNLESPPGGKEEVESSIVTAAVPEGGSSFFDKQMEASSTFKVFRIPKPRSIKGSSKRSNTSASLPRKKTQGVPANSPIPSNVVLPQETSMAVYNSKEALAPDGGMREPSRSLSGLDSGALHDKILHVPANGSERQKILEGAVSGFDQRLEAAKAFSVFPKPMAVRSTSRKVWPIQTAPPPGQNQEKESQTIPDAPPNASVRTREEAPAQVGDVGVPTADPVAEEGKAHVSGADSSIASQPTVVSGISCEQPRRSSISIHHNGSRPTKSDVDQKRPTIPIFDQKLGASKAFQATPKPMAPKALTRQLAIPSQKPVTAAPTASIADAKLSEQEQGRPEKVVKIPMVSPFSGGDDKPLPWERTLEGGALTVDVEGINVTKNAKNKGSAGTEMAEAPGSKRQLKSTVSMVERQGQQHIFDAAGSASFSSLSRGAQELLDTILKQQGQELQEAEVEVPEAQRPPSRVVQAPECDTKSPTQGQEVQRQPFRFATVSEDAEEPSGGGDKQDEDVRKVELRDAVSFAPTASSPIQPQDISQQGGVLARSVVKGRLDQAEQLRKFAFRRSQTRRHINYVAESSSGPSMTPFQDDCSSKEASDNSSNTSEAEEESQEGSEAEEDDQSSSWKNSALVASRLRTARAKLLEGRPSWPKKKGKREKEAEKQDSDRGERGSNLASKLSNLNKAFKSGMHWRRPSQDGRDNGVPKSSALATQAPPGDVDDDDAAAESSMQAGLPDSTEQPLPASQLADAAVPYTKPKQKNFLLKGRNSHLHKTQHNSELDIAGRDDSVGVLMYVHVPTPSPFEDVVNPLPPGMRTKSRRTWKQISGARFLGGDAERIERQQLAIGSASSLEAMWRPLYVHEPPKEEAQECDAAVDLTKPQSMPDAEAGRQSIRNRAMEEVLHAVSNPSNPVKADQPVTLGRFHKNSSGADKEQTSKKRKTPDSTAALTGHDSQLRLSNSEAAKRDIVKFWARAATKHYDGPICELESDNNLSREENSRAELEKAKAKVLRAARKQVGAKSHMFRWAGAFRRIVGLPGALKKARMLQLSHAEQALYVDASAVELRKKALMRQTRVLLCSTIKGFQDERKQYGFSDTVLEPGGGAGGSNSAEYAARTALVGRTGTLATSLRHKLVPPKPAMMDIFTWLTGIAAILFCIFAIDLASYPLRVGLDTLQDFGGDKFLTVRNENRMVTILLISLANIMVWVFMLKDRWTYYKQSLNFLGVVARRDTLITDHSGKQVGRGMETYRCIPDREVKEEVLRARHCHKGYLPSIRHPDRPETAIQYSREIHLSWNKLEGQMQAVDGIDFKTRIDLSPVLVALDDPVVKHRWLRPGKAGQPSAVEHVECPRDYKLHCILGVRQYHDDLRLHKKSELHKVKLTVQQSGIKAVNMLPLSVEGEAQHRDCAESGFGPGGKEGAAEAFRKLLEKAGNTKVAGGSPRAQFARSSESSSCAR